jgi:hypothetical protein
MNTEKYFLNISWLSWAFMEPEKYFLNISWSSWGVHGTRKVFPEYFMVIMKCSWNPKIISIIFIGHHEASMEPEIYFKSIHQSS